MPGLALLAVVLVLGLTPACAGPRVSDASTATAAGSAVETGPDAGRTAVGENGMISSASPYASDAGLEMLRLGGNAVDAAVATAFALGVVEPQMSGLGGGGGMLLWLAGDRRAEYVDFYASKRASTYGGLPEPDSSAPLRVVAVPGQVAGLLEAHERFGRLSRAEVVAPAIRLAAEGVPVNQVLAQMIAADSAKLHLDDDARRLFWPDGNPLGPGESLRQPELAASLRAIVEHGRAAFYEGAIAREIAAVLEGGGNPAGLRDLAAYRPQWKRPLCGEYRGMAVLSAPPPQTGHQVIHTLNLLEAHDLAGLGPPTRSTEAFAVLTSALRAGMAANRHNDDPRWAEVPAGGLVSDAFARDRAALVGTGAAPARVGAGEPARFEDSAPPPSCAVLAPYGTATAEAAPASRARPLPSPRPGAVAATRARMPEPPRRDAAADAGETTHISVVDAEGNAVALTQTNSSLFGSGARAAGFFLNDSGYLFRAGTPTAGARVRADEDDRTGTAATGGSRDWRTRRSTIAPTIVLDDAGVRLVVGAPGGGRIPTAIVQAVVHHLEYGLDPLSAIRMPRIFPAPGDRRVQLENGFAAHVLAGARTLGYEPAILSTGYARLYMIARSDGRWIGAADPRHDGEVRGH